MSRVAFLLSLLVLIFCSPTSSLSNGLALTPPMGWSSWNTFACTINEKVVQETAMALVSSGMAKAGYVYVNIDDCWMGSRDPKTYQLTWDSKKFPSGIPALSSYVHSLGLKLGLYLSSGNLTCGSYTGSWGYEELDTMTLSNWGVDFLKVDSCHINTTSERKISLDKFAAANSKLAHPILLSCATSELMLRGTAAESPWVWGSSSCNMARIWWDITDSWTSTLDLVDHMANLEGDAGPGFWNDMDILTVGMGKQSLEEYKTHFFLWSILASPLIAGNDVRHMTQEVIDILTAPEIIAVSQDPRGIQGRRHSLSTDGAVAVYVKPIGEEAKNIFAVMVMNRDTTARSFEIDFRKDLYSDFLCCHPHYPPVNATVRDLWQRKTIGLFNGSFKGQVNPHGAVMFSVTPAQLVVDKASNTILKESRKKHMDIV